MHTTGLRLFAILAVCCAVVLLARPEARSAERTLRILATTFPIYQLTRNITSGVQGVEVDLMIPAQMGCPHDYALVPQDMRRLTGADVLIVNGLGMEEFLGAVLKDLPAHLKIIDSSRGINQIIYDPISGHEEHGQHHEQSRSGDKQHEQGDGPPNPHLFASPRMAALLAGTIARGLAEADPVGAARYLANGQAYGKEMNQLADELSALGKRLRNNRIVTQHGVFDYLARDMGLEVVAVIQAHAGQEPSAAEMLALVQAVKVKKAGALFTEPQYPQAVGATIARESGIAAARLDPVANGPEQAPLDYYQQVMRTNLTTLGQTLGSN